MTIIITKEMPTPKLQALRALTVYATNNALIPFPGNLKTTGANTSTTPTNYLWLAIPGSSVPRTFQHVDQGFTVVDTPDVTYPNQTIAGQTYQVFGFTNFGASLKISVTS